MYYKGHNHARHSIEDGTCRCIRYFLFYYSDWLNRLLLFCRQQKSFIYHMACLTKRIVDVKANIATRTKEVNTYHHSHLTCTWSIYKAVFESPRCVYHELRYVLQNTIQSVKHFARYMLLPLASLIISYDSFIFTFDLIKGKI